MLDRCAGPRVAHEDAEAPALARLDLGKPLFGQVQPRLVGGRRRFRANERGGRREAGKERTTMHGLASNLERRDPPHN